jgi:hypothetical protein
VKSIEERLKDLIEFVKCPETGSAHYGIWGILNREQRVYLDKLARDCLLLMDKREETIKEIIDKVDDMIGGKMIAQALREIYEVEE